MNLYPFLFSDCTSHCKDCTGDWKCDTCETGYRKETTTAVQCGGKTILKDRLFNTS